jgi:glycerophosphoryl diester phosphodiesterase
MAESAAIGVATRCLSPGSTGSLRLLAFAVGLILLLWAVVNTAVNLLSTTTFSAMMFGLYRQFGCGGEMAAARPIVQASQTTEAIKQSEAGTRFRITPKRLFVACVMGVVLAVAVGALAVSTVRLDDNVKIMAHRGSSKAAPENTLAATRQAIEDGADYVEIDVQETADGQVVVFHDSDFMKLAGMNLRIWATMADLEDIDIGSSFAAEFKDERVPTLAQVLAACQGRIGVNIELKYYGHDEQLEQRVVEIVESCDMASQVVIMSLNRDAVVKMNLRGLTGRSDC